MKKVKKKVKIANKEQINIRIILLILGLIALIVIIIFIKQQITGKAVVAINPPNITLLTPENNSQFPMLPSYNFTFRIIDDKNKYLLCKLTVNYSLSEKMFRIKTYSLKAFNNTIINISYTPPGYSPRNASWQVSCKKSGIKGYILSEKRIFSIDTDYGTPPSVDMLVITSLYPEDNTILLKGNNNFSFKATSNKDKSLSCNLYVAYAPNYLDRLYASMIVSNDTPVEYLRNIYGNGSWYVKCKGLSTKSIAMSEKSYFTITTDLSQITPVEWESEETPQPTTPITPQPTTSTPATTNNPPTITLLTPKNSSIMAPANRYNFSFIVSDDSSTSFSCDFYLNNQKIKSASARNDITNSILYSSTATRIINMSWYIGCKESGVGGLTNKSETRIFSVIAPATTPTEPITQPPTPPPITESMDVSSATTPITQVILISPDDNSILAPASKYYFLYKFISAKYKTSTCNLYINNTRVDSKTVYNNTIVNVSRYLSTQDITWFVNCSIGTSETRALSIDNPLPEVIFLAPENESELPFGYNNFTFKVVSSLSQNLRCWIGTPKVSSNSIYIDVLNDTEASASLHFGTLSGQQYRVEIECLGFNPTKTLYAGEKGKSETRTFYLSQSCECNSCSDCNSKINNINCKEVKLTKDIAITSTFETCITFGGSTNNKTLDCQDYEIKGIYLGGGQGIVVSKLTPSMGGSHTIKNCKISNFDSAIQLYGRGYNTLTENIITNNKKGISMGSSYNNIADNVIKDNTMYGIEMSGSYNKLENNEITNNSRGGIFNTATGSFSNVFSDNVVCDNGIINNADDYDINTGNKGSNINTYTRNKCQISSPEGICEPCQPCEDNTCTNCIDCSQKLSSRMACSLVVLDNDIDDAVSPTGDTLCITIGGNNKIFDLNSYKISAGDYKWNLYQQPTGIWVSAKKNITIRNGEISGFKGSLTSYGIKVGDSYSTRKEKITIKDLILDNNNIGLYVEDAENVNAEDITISNSNTGLALSLIYYIPSLDPRYSNTQPIYNIFKNINIDNSITLGIQLVNVVGAYFENVMVTNTNNGAGISAYSTNLTIFKLITSNNNRVGGISLASSNNNQIRESVFDNNKYAGVYFNSLSRANSLYQVRACNTSSSTYDIDVDSSNLQNYNQATYKSVNSLQCDKSRLNICNTTCIITQEFTCSPSCVGKSCGDDDGCGGSCIVQDCPTGQTCDLTGECLTPQACVPGSLQQGTECLTCNSAGAGYAPNDAKCSSGRVCNSAGACVQACQDTCSSLAYECGTFTICGVSKTCPNSCSSTQTCNLTSGKCISSQICNPGNLSSGTQCLTCNSQGSGFFSDNSKCNSTQTCNSTGSCVDIPANCIDTCSSLGIQCGNFTICGIPTTCNNTCSSSQICNSTNKCISQTSFCNPGNLSSGTQCLTCNSLGTSFYSNDSFCNSTQTCNSTGFCVTPPVQTGGTGSSSGSGYSASSSGGTGVCVATCKSLGKECGIQTVCNKQENCGSCTGGKTCSAGKCVTAGLAEVTEEEIIELEGEAEEQATATGLWWKILIVIAIIIIIGVVVFLIFKYKAEEESKPLQQQPSTLTVRNAD